MKLTIERLTALSAQDLIDLGKIWPQQQPAQWQEWLEGDKALFGARFNQRLLGAMKVTLEGERAHLHDLLVRDVTRRRGVGLYLVEDAQRQLPQVTHWQLSTAGLAARERGEVDNFMRACGFSAQGDSWHK
ncbi:TPA: aspartate 1-decarboxylase autocleavage activator PanM [Serratia odorifera]|nr:aspartate 1-decarboxylase autocleavage activator PanM [Serratia odorifera]